MPHSQKNLQSKIRQSTAPGPCWLWDGAYDELDYGIIGSEAANRAVWQAWGKEPLAQGQKLYRTCENRHCVNPDHMSFSLSKPTVTNPPPTSGSSKSIAVPYEDYKALLDVVKKLPKAA